MVTAYKSHGRHPRADGDEHESSLGDDYHAGYAGYVGHAGHGLGGTEDGGGGDSLDHETRKLALSTRRLSDEELLKLFDPMQLKRIKESRQQWQEREAALAKLEASQQWQVKARTVGRSGVGMPIAEKAFLTAYANKQRSGSPARMLSGQQDQQPDAGAAASGGGGGGGGADSPSGAGAGSDAPRSPTMSYSARLAARRATLEQAQMQLSSSQMRGGATAAGRSPGRRGSAGAMPLGGMVTGGTSYAAAGSGMKAAAPSPGGFSYGSPAAGAGAGAGARFSTPTDSGGYAGWPRSSGSNRSAPGSVDRAPASMTPFSPGAARQHGSAGRGRYSTASAGTGAARRGFSAGDGSSLGGSGDIGGQYGVSGQARGVNSALNNGGGSSAASVGSGGGSMMDPAEFLGLDRAIAKLQVDLSSRMGATGGAAPPAGASPGIFSYGSNNRSR